MLIKYGLLAIGIAGLLGGVVLWWDGHIKDPYMDEGVQKQFNVDKPILTTCHDLSVDKPVDCAALLQAKVHDAAQWKDAAGVCEQSNILLKGGLGACNKSIDDYNHDRDARVDAANKQRDAEKAKATAATQRADELAAIASGPVQPAGTSDEQLRKITDLLDDALANGL